MKDNIDSKAPSLELPKVDWLDRETNPEKFFKDLSYALSEFGFMVLTNAPGLSDEFQKRAFREVRGFFDSPMELKKTAHISMDYRMNFKNARFEKCVAFSIHQWN